MSNEEKGQWVYLVVIVLTYVAYVAIVLSRAGEGALTDVDYVPVMLGAIGIGIALAIVGRIVVEIAGWRATATTRTSATATSGASASTSPARSSAWA